MDIKIFIAATVVAGGVVESAFLSLCICKWYLILRESHQRLNREEEPDYSVPNLSEARLTRNARKVIGQVGKEFESWPF